METRRVAHSEQEVTRFINNPDMVYIGQEENGNKVFKSTKIEDVLSKREKQVFDKKHQSNEKIASCLGISVKTVEAVREKILKKGF